MLNTLRNIVVELFHASSYCLFKAFHHQSDAMESEWAAEKNSEILWNIKVPEENCRGSFTCAALKVILCCACLREVEGPSVCTVEKYTGKAAGC